VCGLAGMIGRRDEIADATDVSRMCRTIVHRGPDDEGIYAQGAVGLGMRRLSIIDLAGGHQPIHNEDQSVWVVFNGEIYNFPELRRELESRGHNFYTHTDTEVIVHLYEEMGSDCVKKLRGMFAIALYDKRRQTLLLARDRMGKKPLHYAHFNGRLLFGSEIKAILAVAPELAEINPEGILQYFYFAYIPDPLTAFQRIHKLPPGHLLEYSDGKVAIRQYWDVPAFGASDTYSDEGECLEELERRLAEAVRIRLISDVPLGALLSGGVDSSVVVALMARAGAGRVKTFSIGFGKRDFNEAEYARMVAERFGTDHHELVVDPNITQTLEVLSHMLEEPFGDSSMIPTYYVCKLARQHVTVALSGDGGDELFAGYDRYAVNIRRERYTIPPWLGKLYRTHIYPVLPQDLRGRKFAWNISLPSRERYLDGLSFLPALDRERSLYTDDFITSARRWADPFEQFRSYYNDAPAHDSLSRLLYLDMKTYLTADILAKVDRMSMATSLEMRCPILDQEFIEWVTSLPVEYKFRMGTRKYLLKKLAERIGVPSALVNRRKQGFSLPLVHWMREELKDGLLGILTEPRTLQRGYFRPEAICALLDEHFRGVRDRTGAIWLLLIFEMWHRNFLEARGATFGAVGREASGYETCAESAL